MSYNYFEINSYIWEAVLYKLYVDHRMYEKNMSKIWLIKSILKS